MPYRSAARLLVLVAMVATSAMAADFPTRKPGIWETTMTLGGGEPIVNKMCFSPEVEHKVQATTAASCSQYEIRQEGASWVIDSTCEIGGHATSGRVVTTGDFTNTIHAAVTSDLDGKKTEMTLDAKWLGPCGPNDKPGAIVR